MRGVVEKVVVCSYEVEVFRASSTFRSLCRLRKYCGQFGKCVIVPGTKDRGANKIHPRVEYLPVAKPRSGITNTSLENNRTPQVHLLISLIA